jgi:hypothetical protein
MARIRTIERKSPKNPASRTREASWNRKLRLLSLRLLRLRAQPDEVAGGMSIGVFIGFTPTVPLHTVLAVAVALLLRKSKLAAALGCWIANPFVLPLIYVLDYRLGQVILGVERPFLEFPELSGSNLLDLGWEIGLPLFTGGMVLGLLSIPPSYFLTKRFVILYRERRRKRLDRIALPSQRA